LTSVGKSWNLVGSLAAWSSLGARPRVGAFVASTKVTGTWRSRRWGAGHLEYSNGEALGFDCAARTFDVHTPDRWAGGVAGGRHRLHGNRSDVLPYRRVYNTDSKKASDCAIWRVVYLSK
jgi:hypothetical protein